MPERLRIVMTGEVDSGKSTLLGRLLYDTDSISIQQKEALKETCRDLKKDTLEFAYLLDSFKEEREEEFTLDTTQVFLRAKGKEYLLIDVPGHEALLKNMLTGAADADAGILVVDIEKSLEVQTKRHLYLLKFLGIEELIIVINKLDLVSYNEVSFNAVKSRVEAFLQESGLKVRYIIPASAKDGENLTGKSKKMLWHRGPHLFKALGAFKPKEQIYDFRFPVQDIYEIKKEKIAVGKVSSGKIKQGDKVKISLQGSELKVKKIAVFARNKRSACAGESIGLVFDQFPVQLKRGRVLYQGRPPCVSSQIQAKIFCLAPLSAGEIFHFNCATQESSAKINRVKEGIDTVTGQINKDVNSLEKFSAGVVLIDTEEPVVIEKFKDCFELGRFVLERDNQICAVGEIF